MDAKGRMALPARNRETVMVASEGRLVVTIDMRESCLLVYPLNEWETVQAKLEGLSNINPQARLLQRLLIGHATDLELDSAVVYCSRHAARFWPEKTKVLGWGNRRNLGRGTLAESPRPMVRRKCCRADQQQ